MKRRKRKRGPSAKAEREAQLRFLEHFSQTGNMTYTCRETKVSRRRVRKWLLSDDERFIAEYNEAAEQASELLEREIYRRAVEGWEEPVFFKGEQAWKRDPRTNALVLDAHGEPIPQAVRKFDSTLLIFLTKGAKPEKYRERFEHGVDPKTTTSLAALMRRAAMAEQKLAPAADRELEQDATGKVTLQSDSG